MATLQYVGLDVHAETITVAVAAAGREEARVVGTIANEAAAVRKVLRRLGDGKDLRVCYEAGPCGYGLYWQLQELGISCEVVAPTLVPRRPGDRVKTDRRDAVRLAASHRAGELVSVWVPDAAHEALRDVVRARGAAKSDERRARHRLDKFLLRHGRRRPARCKAWGAVHTTWLEKQRFELLAQQSTYEDYLNEVTHARARVARLDQAIDDTVETMPEETQALVRGLQALRGVAKTTAVTVVAEVGRFSRFRKASQLMAYSGAVPREYSSGSQKQRGSITKTGNAALRRVLTEASWSYRHRPLVRGDLKRRRAQVSIEICAIADTALHRLCRTYGRLVARGKPTPKAVTAVGRELLGFMWHIGCVIENQYSAAPRPAQTKTYTLKHVA